MTNAQVLEGHWNEIKGKIETHWGQIVGDALEQFHGDINQLAGLIQRKTGENRQQIERYLEELTAALGATAAGSVESARNYTQRMSGVVQDSARRAVEQTRAGYRQAGRFVRRRPGESLVTSFVAGVITGIVIALALRSD
jgi:uncharacterized protein YjbJ (UPF0337 family)